MALFHMSAPCHFGLESVLSGELKALGASEVRSEDGKVCFCGDERILARANLCLRTAERVLIELARFSALSFEDLFQGVLNIPLEDYIGSKDAFPVKGWSLKSKLASVPDCQKIIKKAAVERLKKCYHVEWFAETGPVHQLQFSILKDEAVIMLDTSGVGLHKRGYRPSANEAPIKETLAAGIVDLAGIYGGSNAAVIDPMCGSGTLLIEAALKALQIPPGINRRFAAQNWDLFEESVWKEERARGIERVRKDCGFLGFGSDIDPNAVFLTKENAKKAGILSRLTASTADIKDFSLPQTDGRKVILCNPPYGERLMELRQAEALYKEMGKMLRKLENCDLAIISPHERFESLFGRKADKRRKLYNGMIKCQLYLYKNH